ncbi:LAG1 longevity assurance-like protein 2 [Bienertia sinuspersici]
MDNFRDAKPSCLVYRLFRIGSIVLALHDASDVFMEAAKVFKYSEKELGASFYDLVPYLKISEPYPRFMYYFLNTMLLMLLVFHVYWWILICSMIMRQLKNKGKVGEDIRSDSEDDE